MAEKLSVNSRCNRIYKKLVSTPVDIALQTGKNSGPSERKAVQAQICKYIWGIISSFVANYPKKSLYGSTLTKPLRQFHDLQRNIHRLIAIPFVLVIEPIKNKKLNSELFARNPLLLARPQTFVLHQILRHVSSSEFINCWSPEHRTLNAQTLYTLIIDRIPSLVMQAEESKIVNSRRSPFAIKKNGLGLGGVWLGQFRLCHHGHGRFFPDFLQAVLELRGRRQHEHRPAGFRQFNCQLICRPHGTVFRSHCR